MCTAKVLKHLSYYVSTMHSKLILDKSVTSTQHNREEAGTHTWRSQQSALLWHNTCSHRRLNPQMQTKETALPSLSYFVPRTLVTRHWHSDGQFSHPHPTNNTPFARFNPLKLSLLRFNYTFCQIGHTPGNFIPYGRQKIKIKFERLTPGFPGIPVLN